MASNYNARFRPAEVLVYEGKPYLIRQRETFEDLIRGQVNVDIFSEELGVMNARISLTSHTLFFTSSLLILHFLTNGTRI